MLDEYIHVEQSNFLNGEIKLSGAKNATLVIMASSILINGKLNLKNVPYSRDVFAMAQILQELGAQVNFNQLESSLEIDSSTINSFKVNPEIMRKFRASVLVMGPLLARFGRAQICAPGGCKLGQRPINFHINNFKKMGVEFVQESDLLIGSVDKLIPRKLILEYPSVGATENIILAASLTLGTTTIVNAALEPEVLDLIEVLRKMGAKISLLPVATIEIEGVTSLNSTEHHIMADRLEAGSILLAGAITSGDINIPNANANHMEVFLMKLEEMGHKIIVGANSKGIRLIGTQNPTCVSFKTAQYPCFPTDLQAPMMVAQCFAQGVSEIEETVFENRLRGHAIELQKMGAKIKLEGNKATVYGVQELMGTYLESTDIRASCALVLAALAAKGKSVIKGIHHFRRGYDDLDKKLIQLGAKISIGSYQPNIMNTIVKQIEI